jgi:predicted dinucleotide-binding enzyme
MKIGSLGTGNVGQAVDAKLIGLEPEVNMGTCSAIPEKRKVVTFTRF